MTTAVGLEDTPGSWVPGGGGRVRDGRLLPPPRRPPADPGGTHQPSDAFPGVAAAAAGQLGMHPGSAVTALRFLVHGLDLPGQLGILPLTPGGASQMLVE